MEASCRFCTKFLAGKIGQRDIIWDYVLFQSHNFVVVPSLGAIVEGWLLVVPKRHYLCMGGLTENLFTELQTLRKHVSCVLESFYGPIVAFEHGPAMGDQAVGCGVDHAHLHLVPIEIDLLERLPEVFGDQLEWKPVDGIKDTKLFHDRGLSYLYLEQPLGHALLTTHPNFESQIFRRIIAQYYGRGERYNWREHPNISNVHSTVMHLESRLLGSDLNQQMSAEMGL